jgi:hypothetical protein
MPKFYGKIGFANMVETTPGVWEEMVIERNYYGEVVRNTRKLVASNHLNDNISINNEISIVADPYAKQNFHSMRYVEFLGTTWEVTSVEVQYPRLILSLGGVYNAKQT